MNDDDKKWIEEASFEDLFRKWRFAPSGDPMLQGETGAYLGRRLFKMRDDDPAEYTRISKKIGWG